MLYISPRHRYLRGLVTQHHMVFLSVEKAYSVIACRCGEGCWQPEDPPCCPGQHQPGWGAGVDHVGAYSLV